MTNLQYVYHRCALSVILLSIFLVLSVTTTGHAGNRGAQQEERIPLPSVKNYMSTYKAGCADTLNEEALKLQNAGLDQFWLKGKTKDAVRMLEKAIKKEPKLLPAYSMLNTYYSRMVKIPARAILLLKKSIEHCPNFPNTYYDLGTAYASNGQHSKAIKSYNEADAKGLEFNPSHYYALGNSYARLQQFELAIANYQNALKLDPEKLNVLRNLTIAYFESENKQKALETARKVLEVDQNGEYAAWAREAIAGIEGSSN